MIHDLTIHWPFLWKFVDDTTASEIVHKGDVRNAQSITDQVILWSQEKRMHRFYLVIYLLLLLLFLITVFFKITLLKLQRGT